MTLEQWTKEARRYAEHRYCYPQMVDDLTEMAASAHNSGVDPYDWVETVGEKYDLDRADQNWGINQGKTFEKIAFRALKEPTISPEILEAHAQFGGDLEDMQRRYDASRQGLIWSK